MSYTDKLYRKLASSIQARLNCLKSGNQEWFEKHTDRIVEYQNNNLPHGSGIDAGCKINLEKSTGNKIVIDFSYHAMDENGFYCGWYDYVLTVVPDFSNDFTMRITGKDFNYSKEYFYQLFDYSLREEVE
jgi:hypothetical protein